MITDHRLHLFALFALLVGCSPEVGEGSAAIEEGKGLTQVSAPAAVMLRDGDGIPFCSGLLLSGGTKVLTAAHCFDHFEIEINVERLPTVAGSPALVVRGVAADGADTVAAGTFYSATTTSLANQAFITRYPAGDSQEPTTHRTTMAEGAGIRAIVNTGSEIVAVGWVGTRGQRRAAIHRPSSTGNGIQSQELGPGTATALLSVASAGDEHLVIAGHVLVAGVRRAFIRHYDGSTSAPANLIDPARADYTNILISDIARRQDGTLLISATRVGSTKDALLISIPPTGQPVVTTISSGSSAQFGARAVVVADSGDAVVLVSDATDNRVYRVAVDAQVSLLSSLSPSTHYGLGISHDLRKDTYRGFRARDLARDDDGRLIVVGELQSESSSTVAILRLSSGGVLDPSFGAAGIISGTTDTATTDIGTIDTGTRAGHAGATAVAIAGDVIHVVGRELGRQVSGAGTPHSLITARYAATRGGSSLGMPRVEDTLVTSVVAHPQLDVAIATLATARTPAAASGLAIATLVSPGDNLTCIGMGSFAEDALSSLSQGAFTVRDLRSTIMTVNQVDGAQLAPGDSGGVCFSGAGQISAVVHGGSRSVAGNKLFGVVVPADQFQHFFISNR